MEGTPYTTRIASATMSLCTVCRSMPFRKLIAGEHEVVVNDGFKFNAAGRISSTFLHDVPWNRRRCTVSELVSRAKTCRLCAIILRKIKEERWIVVDGNMVEWEEAKTSISRNLMVWLQLPRKNDIFKCFRISLGTPRQRKTNWLDLDLRKTFGNFHYTKTQDYWN